jgi:sugar phosphate isomerase/epimerase
VAVKLALDPQMFYSSSSVYQLPDIVASLGYDWMELSPKADYDTVFAALAAVEFDGVISSCVFGWEEDARGVSERQRDKALALIDKHFGTEAVQQVRSSKITNRS